MANEKISASPSADLPLDGTELVPIVQDGDNKHCTAQDIADLGGDGGGAVSSVFGRTGVVVAVANDYDASKIQNTPAGGIAATNVQTALNELDTEKAPLASPALTGNPTAPTQTNGDNSTKLATTAYADAKVVQTIINGATTSAPSQDAVFDALALKAPLASPALTGTPTAPTASPSDNSTKIATTAYADAAAAAGVPDATPTTKGKAKLFTATGSGTDGSMDQNSTTTALGLKVAKAGDTMSGALAMGTNKVTGLAAATATGDALRYEQLVFVPDVLTDGATVNWELAKKMFPTATWAAATTTTTLAFTTSGNVLSGAMGSLKITTGTASPITITFPAGFTHKMQNVTFTTYTLPAGTGKDYVLTFWVVGTTLEWVIGVSSPRAVQAACSDELSSLNTGTNKLRFRMPYAMTLTEVRASLNTAQSTNGPYGGIFTVDINKNGTTILSTKLTIDNGEKTSVTAATAAVISVTALADDDEIEIDIDQIGDGTAAGLKITLLGV